MSALALFLLGFVLLVLAADSLHRGVAGLGQGLGFSPASTSLLVAVVSAALPAVALSAYASAAGAPALALGHAVGAGLASLGVVAGVLALAFAPTPAMRSLSTLAVLVAVGAGLLLAFGRDGTLARWEGAVLLLAWLAGVAAVSGRSRVESAGVKLELAEAAETSTLVGQNLVRLAIAGALLYFGSRWIVQGAPAVGAALGLEPLATGLYVLATGSALPVLVPAALAAARGQRDFALAQALGAAVGQALLATGGLALATPLEFAPTLLRATLPALFVLAAALWLLLRRGARLGRREGVLLLAVFLAWLGMGLARAWH